MTRTKTKEPSVWSYDLTGPMVTKPAPIKPTPGIVFVQIQTPPEERNGLALPSRVAAGFRNHIGVVIASNYDELQPGDNVVCKFEFGTWRDELAFGDYRSEGEVISFGVYVDEELVKVGYGAEIDRFDASHGVVGKLEFMEGAIQPKLRPVGIQILVKRSQTNTTDRGLILPDAAHWRDNTGVIVGVGGHITDPDIQVGKTVLYNPWASTQAKGLGEDLAFVPYEGIEAVLD